MLLIHGGYDGVGAADGLVSHADGLPGLDIGEAVVVDDLHYLGLLQSGDGLRLLVGWTGSPASPERLVDEIARHARSGDVDPGLHAYLIRNGMSIDEVDDLLNKRSGMGGMACMPLVLLSSNSLPDNVSRRLQSWQCAETRL